MSVRRWPYTEEGRSRTVASNGLVWTVANTPDGNPEFDIQVQQSLAMLGSHLEEAGSDRRYILSLQIIMTNIENRARFDEYWQRWIGTDPQCWPQRACF